MKIKLTVLIKLFLFVIFSGMNSYSQKQEVKQLDTSKVLPINDQIFKIIINKEFGALMGTQSRTDIGNFAALDLKEAEVSFSGNFVFKNASVLGIKLSGASLDGIMPIFSNTSLNSKLGIGAQYSFLVGDRTVTLEDVVYKAFIDKQRAARLKYETDYLKALNEQAIVAGKVEEMKAVKAEKETQLKKYNDDAFKRVQRKAVDQKMTIRRSIEKELENTALSQSERENCQVEWFAVDAEVKAAEKEIKSAAELANMSYEIQNTNLSIKNYERQMDEMKPTGVRTGVVDSEMTAARETFWEEAEKVLAATDFTLQWITVGYSLGNSDFKLFDSKLVYDQQIMKDHNVSHKVTAQWSRYHLSSTKAETYFVSAGLIGGISDNLSELTAVEINERNNYNTGDYRYTVKKYAAYIGDYKENIRLVHFNADYYHFFFKDNFAAVHLFPEYVIKNHAKPRINSGIGLVFNFKDETKAASVVTAEVYYDFEDWTDNADPEMSNGVFKRGNLGVRFSFPIKFNPKTQ
jgi:hypothetical protein